MMTKEGSTKSLNFMTPGAGVLVLGHGHTCIVKMQYFFSSYCLHWHDYVVMMTKGGSTKSLNFMTPGAGVLLLGCGQIRKMIKIHYFFKNLHLYSQS